MYCTPCCCQHYYRISDGGVFRNSPLSKALSSDENPLSIPDPKDIESRRKIPYIILADYASPLKVLIMRCHSSLNLTLHHIYIEREREVNIKCTVSLANQLRAVAEAFCPLRTHQRY